ncbi:unnamed protein product, partial [Effrenium voratum]
VKNMRFRPELPRERPAQMDHAGFTLRLNVTKPPSCKPWLDAESDVENVFFASIHGFGGGFYPGTGATCSRFHPRIINAPLQKGAGSAEFRAGLRRQVLPQLQEFDPDLVFISAGFDGHEDDLLGCCNLSEEDYIWATQQLMAVANRCCQGRVVSVLEGGYNTRAEALSPFAAAVASHVRTLMYTSQSFCYLDYEVEGQSAEDSFQRIQDLYEQEHLRSGRRAEARRLRRKRGFSMKLPPPKVARCKEEKEEEEAEKVKQEPGKAKEENMETQKEEKVEAKLEAKLEEKMEEVEMEKANDDEEMPEAEAELEADVADAADGAGAFEAEAAEAMAAPVEPMAAPVEPMAAPVEPMAAAEVAMAAAEVAEALEEAHAAQAEADAAVAAEAVAAEVAEQAEPEQAEPEQAEPEQAEPGEAEEALDQEQVDACQLLLEESRQLLEKVDAEEQPETEARVPECPSRKSSVSSMVASVQLLTSAPPAPPSALLAPPAPPKPPPAGEASGYWTRPRSPFPPAPALARQAQKDADLLLPQTLSPWVLPATRAPGPLPEHEAQLLGRLLQGLQESSLSVHDVVGVMELDLRRPGYGDSLAQTVAAEGSGPEPAATAPAPAPAAPAASAEGDADCARCRVLERQMRAMSQALAGLAARLFNWTVQASLHETQKTFLWDLTQQYLQPCAHLDGRIAETCASLSAALRQRKGTSPAEASAKVPATSAKLPAAGSSPGSSPAPVIDEVLVSFRATAEAQKLNGVYRRREDLQANGRPVYCNGNRHVLYMADGAWVIKEGPGSEEGAYVYAYVEDPADQPFAVRKLWQVMDDRDGFVEEREGLVRRNVR